MATVARTVITFLLLLIVTSSDAAQRCAHNSTNNECVVLAWLPYWDQKAAFESYEQNHQSITHVSFFWFYLDKFSKIKKYKHAKVKSELINRVHNNGDKAYAIITNLPDLDADDPLGDWNRETVRKMMADDQTMTDHIDDLVELVLQYNFDGINIDYENLHRADRSLFTEFITKLGNALHTADKELAVALHPKSAEFKRQEDNGSHAQDWVKLSPYVDQMHIMAYGQHYTTGPPGPITGYNWLNGILAYLDRLHLNKQKFVLGLPLYAEVWRTEDGHTRGIDMDFTYNEIQRLKKKYNGVETYHRKSQSNRLTFTNREGRRHVAFFDTRRSITGKLALARKWGVNNVAFWRIGGEDPGIWSIVDGHLSP